MQIFGTYNSQSEKKQFATIALSWKRKPKINWREHGVTWYALVTLVLYFGKVTLVTSQAPSLTEVLVLDFGFRILQHFGFVILDYDFGFWISDVSFWILNFRVLHFGFSHSVHWDFGFLVSDFGFWMLLLDFGLWIFCFNGFGFLVLVLGFCFEFWMSDLGFGGFQILFFGLWLWVLVVGFWISYFNFLFSVFVCRFFFCILVLFFIFLIWVCGFGVLDSEKLCCFSHFFVL